MPMTRMLAFGCLVLALGWWLLLCTTVGAQDVEAKPLHFDGLMPSGLRSTLSQNWGTLELTLTNPNPTDRDARVLVFYTGQPDVQYGRDVWVPGHSTLSTWMLVGPAPPQQDKPGARDLQILLYDRTGGQDRLVLPPGQRRIRSRFMAYGRREPLTSVLLDRGAGDAEADTDAPQDSKAEEILEFVRAFRASCNLSAHVSVVQDNFLPPTADAFDGIDHFVLASGRLAEDPPGQVALRRWLEQGGKLWVMLDRTDPGVVARLLGDGSGFRIVDRTSLNTVRIQSRSAGRADEDVFVRELEQPVDFVRVLLTPEYKVLYTVDGWPASFIRSVGRGRVLVTTLGGRGWFRPRTETDPASPFTDYPDLPVLSPALELSAQELLPPPELNSFSGDAIRSLMTDEIGYSVIGVRTAGLIFGVFLLVMLIMGVALRRWRRSELAGWLSPAAALIAAAIFLGLEEASRRGVPPTVAVAQLVDVNPRADEQPVTGLLAVYRPHAGPVTLASTQGGLLELDMTGLEGQTRRLVVTDIDAWHWENLALPARVRMGSLRYTTRTGTPVSAVARFGPEGVEGKLAAGPFPGLADALIRSPTRRALAVKLRPDGTFTVGDEDLLPAGQYVTGAVLSDRQQRRQAVYQQLLARADGRDQEGRSALLAWAEPTEVPFTFEAGTRTVGSALLVIPLEFERSPPGTRVTVPRGFVLPRRMLPRGTSRPTLQGQSGIDMHLRFQVPSSVLPIKVERARLFAKVNAPSRRFIVAGHADSGRAPLLAVTSPVDPIRLDIVRQELLRLDDQGGLHLDVAVSDPAQGDDGGMMNWSIESLELEVVGRTLPEK